MTRLSPTLNSFIGPRPAKSISDVKATLRDEVEYALEETDQRIKGLDTEIEDKVRARVSLIEHRASLQAWLEQEQ